MVGVGHTAWLARDFGFEFGFEFVEGGDAGGEFGFFDDHDGDAVADGVGEAADLGDEPVAFLAKGAAREGATQDA